MPFVQHDLTEEQVRKIEHGMAEAGLSTKKDFFNNALTLFALAVAEKKQGYTVMALDEKTGKRRQSPIPVLRQPRRRRQAQRAPVA